MEAKWIEDLQALVSQHINTPGKALIHADNIFHNLRCLLLASERSERDTLMSVQLRIADIYIIIIYYIYIVRAIFVLITRKEGGA